MNWTESIPDPEIYNPEQFTAALNHKTNNPIKVFKDVLGKGDRILDEAFIAGAPIEKLVHRRAWLTDQILIQAWHLWINDKNLALVAVGGYGRGELHPASDIDLMILLKHPLDKPAEEKIEKFLVFLWDIGLEVGHSVRTVKECVSEGKADITVATNLMESRLLIGDNANYENMRKNTGPEKIWPTRKFFAAKLEEQTLRHKKFEGSEQKLEPNIKESPGGLRDIQMIGWVAKRYFQVTTLADLVTHDFLTQDEYDTLIKGQLLLWRIRYALHYICQRREDRLLFDYQRNVAELFDYKAKDNSGIEQFMKLYYRTVRELNILNDILLQHFQEAIIYAKRREKIKPINRRFQVRNDLIEVTNNNVFKRSPFALLEIFLLIQQDPKIKGVRASTIRLIRKNVALIDRNFRNDIRNRSLFMEIMKQPRYVGHELRRMHRYGVLSKYLPLFDHIEGLMQFDLFHVYTVDEHILQVVKNLRLFGSGEDSNEQNKYRTLLETLPKLELLYLAGLFHDIAKGRGGDHSVLGAKDAQRFCKLHGLSEYDAKLVAWLVDKHLTMSRIAQRMDINDPDVINDFAELVGDRNHLNYLYLLTVADIQGTNPELWNSWKETLLADLHSKTFQALRRGLENPINKKELIRDSKRRALEILWKKKKTRSDFRSLWRQFGEDYFLRYTPYEIAWQTESISKHKGGDAPLVLIRENKKRGGTALFIYMKNQDKIFATTTMILEKLRISVVDARIISSRNNFTLDTYIILEADGSNISGKARRDEIIKTLEVALGKLPEFKPASSRNKTRRIKNFITPTRVLFRPDPANSRNIMEVITTDSPGVLSRIGIAMDQCAVRLQGAKVATIGARVEDIFFITDKNNRMIEDDDIFDCLNKMITANLDSV